MLFPRPRKPVKTVSSNDPEALQLWPGLVPLLQEDRGVIQALEDVLRAMMDVSGEHDYFGEESAQNAQKMIRALRCLPVPVLGIDLQFSVWIHRDNGRCTDLDLHISGTGVDFQQSDYHAGDDPQVVTVLEAPVGGVRKGRYPKEALAWVKTAGAFALAGEAVYVFDHSAPEAESTVDEGGTDYWKFLPRAALRQGA